MIDDAKLDFWIQNDFNVAFRGKHGTGKTSTILKAFERNNLKWLYFSAPTLDPWVDFLGVPREQRDADGNLYLDFVLPKALADGSVQAIFLDEYNRSHKKIRNAVMELIQFKSINGRKFPNLKIVWTAINPVEDESSGASYDVEELDPAQLDRFHVIVDVDSAPSKQYFTDTYGTDGKIAVDWWNSLAKEAEHIQKTISPRRLEYALQMYHKGGDVKDVLGQSVNTSVLTNQLKEGSFAERLSNLYANNNEDEIRKELKKENFFPYVYKTILDNEKYFDFFVQYFPTEKLNKELMSNTSFRTKILKRKTNVEKFIEPIQDIIKADVGKRDVLKEFRIALKEHDLINTTDQTLGIIEFIEKYYNNADENLETVKERTIATAIMNNISITSLSEEQKSKLAIVNAIIGAKTFGSFWSDTTNIFQKLGYLPDNSSLLATKNDESYYKNQIKDIMMKDSIFNKCIIKDEYNRFNLRINKIIENMYNPVHPSKFA